MHNFAQTSADRGTRRFRSLLKKSFIICIKQNRATLGVTQEVIVNYVMHEGQIQYVDSHRHDFRQYN